jgi:aminoglycoside phosphotransferase (APT) family kinase protein
VTSVAGTALPLAELTAPDPMTAVLAAALGPDAGAVTDIEVLEHKPGRRALLRYETAGSGTIYGKAFADATRARHSYDVMTQVAAAGLTAPRPLGLVPDLALVLYDPLRGPSLDTLVGTHAMVDAITAAGAWITTMHESDIDLDRVLDLEHEAANALTWGETIAAAFPDLALPSARLTATVADAIPTPTATNVPIHKDFHYQHVIVGDTLGVVDMDEARMGDRLFDVGHFLANLELLSHRTAATDAERDCWVGAFAERCHLGTADAGRVNWFAAYTCVKLAKQLATGQGPHPRPSGDDRREQVAWVLHRGLSVVNG